jgi:hypothetical protein
MADDWRETAREITMRAFEIANSPEADEIRAETLIGGGSVERAMLFGLAAAMLELQGASVELAGDEDAVDPEIARLREENERLRAILDAPPAAPAEGEDAPAPVALPPEPGDDASADELAAQNDELRAEAFGDPDAERLEASTLVLDESGSEPEGDGESVAAPPASSPIDPDDHSKDELIAMAEAQGVSSEGTKAEIAARLS